MGQLNQGIHHTRGILLQSTLTIRFLLYYPSFSCLCYLLYSIIYSSIPPIQQQSLFLPHSTLNSVLSLSFTSIHLSLTHYLTFVASSQV